jgi:hypothetical protein
VRNKLVIPVGVVAVIALTITIFTVPKKGVSAYSTDKRVVIYDAQYSEGTNLNYSYVEPASRLKYKFEGLLGKVGIRRLPWKRVFPVVIFAPGLGPALVVYGRIEVSYESLELVSDSGKSLPLIHSPLQTPNYARANSSFYLWDYALTNGTYHLRAMGETNDLAVVRIR